MRRQSYFWGMAFTSLAMAAFVRETPRNTLCDGLVAPVLSTADLASTLLRVQHTADLGFSLLKEH